MKPTNAGVGCGGLDLGVVALQKVIGCNTHDGGYNGRQVLQDSTIFSMSNLRDVADRMISGFLYEHPHNPPCAREQVLVS